MTATRLIDGTFGVEHAEERLDRALVAALGGADATLTRSRIKSLIEGRHVRIDGATVSEPSRRVKPGQRFVLELPPPSSGAIEAQPMALVIVHEDDDLIVIDKPAGLVVHPAAGNPDRTLVNALLAHCGESLRAIGGAGRPGIVHRLDKDTSGLLVAAKTQAALLGLARQFAEHSVDRVYEALVWGLPSPGEGEIAGAIGRSPGDRKKMAVLRKGGRPALTRYRVLEVLGRGLASRIECRLATGRTHQIRVHLANIGHPLLGDPAYGRAAAHRRAVSAGARDALDRFTRQALDAVVLGFDHPRTGERLRFSRAPSPDVLTLAAALRAT